MIFATLLDAFDQALRQQGNTFEALVSGPGALLLHAGQANAEPPAPLDVLCPDIWPYVLGAAAESSKAGGYAGTGWIRERSIELPGGLPAGWHHRMQIMAYAGQALFLHALAPEDVAAAIVVRQLSGERSSLGSDLAGLSISALERLRDHLDEWLSPKRAHRARLLIDEWTTPYFA
jgi:hypothetical protein